MPSQEVIRRTEELIRVLRELEKQSGNTGASLADAEKFLERLVGVNLGNLRDVATTIADFSKNLKGLTRDADTVKQLSRAFSELLTTIQSTVTMYEKMSALGKAGAATKKLNLAITSGDVAEQQRQRDIITQQKAIAEEARQQLLYAETAWKTNLQVAERISELRSKVMLSLFAGAGRTGYPQLPGGMISYPQLTGGNIPLGPGGNITNYPTSPGNLLPAGPQRNVPLLPPGAPTIITTPYTGGDVKRLPASIDEAVAGRVKAEAEAIRSAPINVESRQVMGESLGGLGTTTGTTIRRGGRDLGGMWAEEKTVNVENLKTIGLTDVAAKNLEKTMKGLGMTSAKVTGNVTELSTGIQTVSFQAEETGGAIRNFTTHLDRNGNVLQDTQKRFRSFGSAVMRDVVEVLKWTIAITAIYTPIRKLGELLEQMKKIQLDMVDVQIVLGNSTRQFATVLEASSQIATETSSSLEGVIEGYSLAAAAATSAGDETQRTVATQTMLKDSMILAKLANIDQKQALDTLVGSLSQLGMGLLQGTQLLDSWVAVSKKANVSVNQMATSFTIVGSAAQEAGVNYNELNALIGALAQSTNLSADELGNAIRGIIAAMQTDKAQQAFAEYGIATKTVSGDFRDLMDILKQLKQMSESGILDEKAMGALTQAGGAGARRGAQLSALVKNLDTVMNLVSVSENASGDAAQALGLEMGTLDAATTRLNNAFSELAVTLGTEGGVLGFLTSITNVITSLVKGVRDLTGVLKTAAPVLATFMLARGIMATPTGGGLLNKNIPTSLASLFIPSMFGATNAATGQSLTGAGRVGGFAPISNWLLGRTQATGWGARGMAKEGWTNLARTATVGEFFGGMWNGINTPFATMLAARNRGVPSPWQTRGAIPLYSTVEQTRGAGVISGGLGKMSLGTLLGPLLIAASNIGQPGGGVRAGAGGIGGLLMAGLTGSPLWATVGSIIATAFYDKFLTFEDDMATTWAAKIAEARTATEQEGTPESALERLNKEARASMSAWEIFNVNKVNWMMNTWSKLPWSTQGGKQVTQAETLLGLAIGGNQVLDEETRKKVLDAYEQLIRNQAEATEEMNVVPTTQQTEIARLAATASADIMTNALEQISVGAAGSIQNYLDAKTLAQKVGSTVTQLINAQMLMMQPVTIGVGATAKTITPAPPGFAPMTTQEATKFIAGLNEEEASAIVSYYTEITDLLTKIQTLNEQIAGQTGGVPSEAQQKDLDAYAQRLSVLPQEFAQVLQAVQQGSVFRKIEDKFKPTITLPEMTPEQFQQVSAQAEIFWREYLRASGLTEDEINQWIKNQQEQIVMMQDKVSQFRTNIPQEFFPPALGQAGITEQMPGLVDWRQYTMGQFQQAQTAYPQFVKAIQQLLPTWKPDESDALYFLKDDATTAHVDQMIMQMLMRDLIDIEEEKGLQGMYNLPAGATFYVPVTAYELHRQTQAGMAGGGGGLSSADILSIIQQAITAGATARLQASEQQFQQAQQTGIQNVQAVKAGEGFTFGGQQYKMFGPPVPEGLQQYTQGNPLPVTVTNWAMEGQAALTPEIRAQENQPLPAQPQESPLPTWLQWTEEIGPAVSRLNELIGKLFAPENFDIGTPNQTNYVPTERAPITTALNLAVDSKIVLTVDGRTLATIIKPYLYEDLLRFNATTSSTNRSVIA